MPDCVKVARQTLTLFVWVRILVGQPKSAKRMKHLKFDTFRCGVSMKIDILRDVAQLGRALRSGRRGRKFKSCHPDHTPRVVAAFFFFADVVQWQNISFPS